MLVLFGASERNLFMGHVFRFSLAKMADNRWSVLGRLSDRSV